MEDSCRRAWRTIKHLGYWHIPHTILLVSIVLYWPLMYRQQQQPAEQSTVEPSHGGATTVPSHGGATTVLEVKPTGEASFNPGTGTLFSLEQSLVHRQLYARLATDMHEIHEGTQKLFLRETSRLILHRDYCRQSTYKLPRYVQRNRFSLTDIVLPNITSSNAVLSDANISNPGTLLSEYKKRLVVVEAMLVETWKAGVGHRSKEELQEISSLVDEVRAAKNLSETRKSYYVESLMMVDFEPEHWCNYLKCRHSITESQEQAEHNMRQELTLLKEERDKDKHHNTEEIKRLIADKKAEMGQLETELSKVRDKKAEKGMRCRLLHKKEACKEYEVLEKQIIELDKKYDEEDTKSTTFIQNLEYILDSVASRAEEVEVLEIDIKEFNASDSSKDAGHTPEIVYSGQKNIYPFKLSSAGWSEAAKLPHWTLSVSPSFDESGVFTKLLSELSDKLNKETTDVVISAILVKVDVKRPWLNESWFSFKVPGGVNKTRDWSPAHPPEAPSRAAGTAALLTPPDHDSYPLYPSSLILATDIVVTLQGFQDTTALFEMAYEPIVSGYFGPFSFGHMFFAGGRKVKFRVDKKDGGVVLEFPGTQLIGYTCKLK